VSAGFFEQAGEWRCALVQRVMAGDPAGDHARVDLSRVGADQGDLDAWPWVGRQIADYVEMGMAGTSEQEAFHLKVGFYGDKALRWA
jgi:hypothetical protein